MFLVTLKKKFILGIAFSLVVAFLAAELLTRFVFYPSIPLVRLPFRIWFAAKKRQIATLPQKILWKIPVHPSYQLPPPIVYKPPQPTPTRQPPSPPAKQTPHPAPPRITPRPLRTPTPSPPSTPSPIDQAIIMANLINQERAKRGLKTLKKPPLLMKAAQDYINDLGPYLRENKKCSHSVPSKGLIWDYAIRLGYRKTPIGEVVMCGGLTPSSAVKAWLKSPPHRAIILSENGGSIGTGVWQKYWVAGVFY